eukprot:14805804-Alexandrium_andersonii.AAC.1
MSFCGLRSLATSCTRRIRDWTRRHSSVPAASASSTASRSTLAASCAPIRDWTRRHSLAPAAPASSTASRSTLATSSAPCVRDWT